jgi:tetratricopeptide (TPR) repeat protein
MRSDRDSNFGLPLLKLPDAPTHVVGPVRAWSEDVEIYTYAPQKPNPNPMFLEKRVYQGSSGRVYPLPFIDRIATEPAPRAWKAWHIENEYLRIMILPEIGGRLHVGFDKTSGYDFFYRQNVIKPALVGLAGPWISGGVEFNWPQHHRPATFMPVETEIEHHNDGSVTIWCSDHDPMLHMKGMHGVCLHPDRAVLELKVRLFNRTQLTQTFLWWANVATRVHEQYQSFFPPDVRFVADHAKRAVSTFPQSDGTYYGVDYAERARTGVPADETPRMFVPDGSYPANDLSWYANIPVPTSYMITDTEADFFGGYDHKADAGVVHIANHHIAPGKKQWTWGNHEFGYAWDRSLTDADGPYIELMAGVYTDNQPDFSFLAPWETKTFTQTWYPIHKIGVPKVANHDAALSIRSNNDRSVSVGIYPIQSIAGVTVVIRAGSLELDRWAGSLDIAKPLILAVGLPAGIAVDDVSVAAIAGSRTLIEYDPKRIVPAKTPEVAQEPLAPDQIESIEQLYLTGLHLEQYRHATRRPEIYWQEALKRDCADSRSLNALGLWRLRRGEFHQAEQHFRIALARLTQLNPNPYDGEAYYNLGITLRYAGDDKGAYDAFYKATWNAAWRGPGYFALAEIDSKRHEWNKAIDHLQRCLKAEQDNLNACNLLGYVYQQVGKTSEAAEIFNRVALQDPLDVEVRWRKTRALANGQEILDFFFDLIRSGREEEARQALLTADTTAQDGTAPIVLLALAKLETKSNPEEAEKTFSRAVTNPLDYCFPSRLEELILLEDFSISHPHDGVARYLLGNFLYDRRRHEEAIASWEAAALHMPRHSILWRNLGIAYFNIRRDESSAVAAFERAIQADPSDGRIFYERDQLWKRIGKKPEHRLSELLQFPELVQQRDDLSVELATLYNQLRQPEKALELVLDRHFQPWEGGEGLVLGQYVRSHCLLGRRNLRAGDIARACRHFYAALEPPESIGEAKHLLANQSEIYYWLGVALERSANVEAAQQWWVRAARQKKDFQQMSVQSISAMTYWSALSQCRLGETENAEKLFQDIYRFSMEIEATDPKIDYFATSLPAMLLFEDNLKLRQEIEAHFLRAQALAGLNRPEEAKLELDKVLQEDANHAGAIDLLEDLQTPFETGNAQGTNVVARG